MNKKRSFAPIIDADVRILILGSLPGEQSLARNEYYGNRHNKFWTLLSAVIHTDLISLPYQHRLETLLKNHIGLWDVVAEAHRDGSLDSNIKDPAGNDLSGLLNNLPQLQTIGFNGATAARLGLKTLGSTAEKYRILLLPSSSPAHTKPYAEKIVAWHQLTDAM